MNAPPGPHQAAAERRVLLRALTARDAAMAVDVLGRAGVECRPCASLAELVAEMPNGVGAVVLAEESLLDPAFADLERVLHAQPPWSDLPVTILARQGADSTLIDQAMKLRANITVLERPLRVSALVSTLRSALRGRTRQYELRDILQRLETADQRKNEFLATLAHELRNPLAPIGSGLEILQRNPDRATTEHCLGMMERQVDHMARLIDDLMQVSRITRGKIELQRELLSLDRVLAEAIESTLPLIESRQHRLEVSIPEERWPARADAVRLTQVFANLIANAAKYSPPRSRIEVTLARDGDQARVSVRDDGDGIAPERLGDIFGMFVQVGDRSRSAQGGLGIGLTLADNLVRLHGGRLTAHSDGLGRGSEFVVALPLALDAAPPPHKTPGRSGGAALRGHVLIVDDNRDAADALAFLLRSMGASTDVAYDGHGALDYVARRRPHAAVLDIGMPGMDGCELAQRLRADPACAGVLLVALTGWGQSGDRARIQQAGFEHHLLKPLNVATLVDLLRPKLAAAG